MIATGIFDTKQLGNGCGAARFSADGATGIFANINSEVQIRL